MHPTDDHLPRMRPSDPVVPADVVLPEITIKAVVVSIILAAVLAAANAYLGLFAGMTVSASIPAAVVSMAILRLFRRSNILENNIVQTAASSGEALAAGVIFTIPALVLVGYWSTFEYWSTVAMATVGGLLGVLFTIPLRRALIITARLRFPEGVATAEVLKAGGACDDRAGVPAEQTNAGVTGLLWAALAGGAVKFGEAGMRLWTESLEGAIGLAGTVFYGGINLSPALLAVGYIVGWNTAVVVFLGGVMGWGVVLPIAGWLNGVPDDATAMAAARGVWGGRVRYVGIGAMLVGGLWTVTRLRAPVWHSLLALHQSYRATRAGSRPVIDRTERDASLPWILLPFLLALIPMAMIYAGVVGSVPLGVAMTAVMVVAAFLFSSVAAYMAGLVGSSSNPVSGVTIATIMLASLLLLAAMGSGHPAGPAAALVIGTVVCCAAAMGGDNLQDLKTGHLVGATPWKQQIMQVIGVLTGAFVLVPVLSLMQAKYGIGEPTALQPHPLSAPQATLMANLTRSLFGTGLPWTFVGFGGLIAIGVIAFDQRQHAHGRTFRVPVLAVALGIYLPLKLSATILLGGLIAAWAARRAGRSDDAAQQGLLSAAGQQGLLTAAGLITGEALMGIIVALPIALSALIPALGSDPFAVFSDPPLGAWPGVLVLSAIAWLLWSRAAARGKGG